MTENKRDDLKKMLDEQQKIHKDRIRRRKIVRDTISFLKHIAEKKEADE